MAEHEFVCFPDPPDPFPRPDGVPQWLWRAVSDLYGRIPDIESAAGQQGQVQQDPAAEEYEWRERVAAVLTVHYVAAARNAWGSYERGWPTEADDPVREHDGRGIDD